MFNAKKEKNNKLIRYFFLITIPFLIGYFLSFKHQSNFPLFNQNVNGQAQLENIDFNLYFEVWQNIKNDYVDHNFLDDQEMFYGSLKGLTNSLNDPYTVFLDPTETEEFYDDLSGSFEGIGAEVGIRDEMVTIIAPLKGMPAEKAGLRSGDKIYAINGEITMGMSINEAVRKIRGPKDTEVMLTILREEEEQALEISIQRGIILVKSVEWELLEDDIFLISISNFHEDTLGLFNQAVMEMKGKNVNKLILDLRNNPGGYLETAIDLASEWIKEGPVVIEQLRGNKRKEHFTTKTTRLNDIETIVLINEGSASASEILAGALRDYHLATLIGEQTFGKGSVQNLKKLSDGSALKISVAKWLTPAGDYINEKGIEPNIIVEISKEDYENEIDPQMNKAIELLNN
jgi:carboxyl-terminal processing protease